MPLAHLSLNEQWDDLLQSLDFVERRFTEWLKPKQIAYIRDVFETRRQKWTTARSSGQDVPRNSGLPVGHVGESPASRSLRYWTHVRHELRALADDGRLSLVKSHELLAEVRERQSALERKLAPEELPEVIPVGEEYVNQEDTPPAEIAPAMPRRNMLEIVLDPRNIQMLLALGGALMLVGLVILLWVNEYFTPPIVAGSLGVVNAVLLVGAAGHAVSNRRQGADVDRVPHHAVEFVVLSRQ
jgi:hypothetical protein